MATNKSTKNAPKNPEILEEIDIDTILSEYELVEAEVGFPPYWKAEVGKYVFATMLGLDTSDPDFHRVVMQAKVPTKCQKGPADDADEIMITPGNRFTMSVYAGIIEELKECVGLDVVLQVVKTRPMKDAKKNDMFEWKLRLPPAHHALLKERQAQATALFTEGESSEN